MDECARHGVIYGRKEERNGSLARQGREMVKDGMAWTFRAGLGLVEYVMKCPKVFRNPSCD